MRNLAPLLIAAMLSAAAVACTPTEPSPGGDVNVNQNVNVNVGQPNPTASPSADPRGTVARVGIGKVAETPATTNQSCSGRGDAVKIGCTAFLTCSPFTAAGVELFNEADIGTAPEKFSIDAGTEFASQAPHGSNAFNIDVTGNRPGSVTISCKVRGVTSPPFLLQVVQ